MKHSAPFWSWNGDLKISELRRQMRYFKKMGLGGVFMHSRTGLVTPYLSRQWFDRIRGCIQEGKKLGLKTWLYDEDRWPSGYAGSFITRHKKHRMHYIFFDEKLPGVPPAPGKKIRDFVIDGKEVSFTLDCGTFTSWFNGYCYANTLSSKTTKAFLDVTHERYEKECEKGDYPGVFTDEPQYGYTATKEYWFNSHWVTFPYDPQIRRLIKKRYGYDIFDRLPELFTTSAGGEFQLVRYHYIRVLTELLRKNHIALVGKWHKDHDLIYTGHMMGEDTLLTQTWNCGDAMCYYPHFGMPGIDQLEAMVFNPLPPRQLGSVAKQYGKKDCLAETYGCAGWEFPPEGHKIIGDLLLGEGINFRCQHLADYTLGGESKRDCPASVSFQLPWTSEYHWIEERFDRIADHLYDCERYGEVLMLSPVESVWGMAASNFTDDAKVKAYNLRYCDLLKKLRKESIPFDLGSEILLGEKGKVKDGKLFLGKAGYKAVILPEMRTIRSSTLKLLQEFEKAGGLIIAVSSLPEYVDGMVLEGAFPLGCQGEWNALDAFKKWSFSEGEGILHGALYRDGKREQLFLTNTSCEQDVEGHSNPWKWPPIEERRIVFPRVTIRWKTDKECVPCGFDPDTGRYYKLKAVREKDAWVIESSFDRLESRLFVLDERIRLPREKKEKGERQIVTLPGEMDFSLTGKNLLLLDHFQVPELGEGEQYVLDVDRKIREKLSLIPRGGFMLQPWVEGKKKEGKGTEFTLRAGFESELSGMELWLALEDPGRNIPYLNGFPARVEKGKWYLDPAFRLLRFPAEALQKGKNLLEIRTTYNEAYPGVEACYLLGDFAVDRAGTKISALPGKLKRGDIADQGLPFFCGGVKYRFAVKREGRGPLILQLPFYYGAMVIVRVAGKKAGVLWHAPLELDISRFIPAGEERSVELELLDSPRNMLGPFYMKEYVGAWPSVYYCKEKEDRTLVKVGFEEM